MKNKIKSFIWLLLKLSFFIVLLMISYYFTSFLFGLLSVETIFSRFVFVVLAVITVILFSAQFTSLYNVMDEMLTLISEEK